MKISSPSAVSSEKTGALPQPMNTFPFGRSCVLAWLIERMPVGWMFETKA